MGRWWLALCHEHFLRDALLIVTEVALHAQQGRGKTVQATISGSAAGRVHEILRHTELPLHQHVPSIACLHLCQFMGCNPDGLLENWLWASGPKQERHRPEKFNRPRPEDRKQVAQE